MLKIAIVDDEPLAARRLISVLHAFDDVDVVGSARDAEQGLRLIADKTPDLVLLDIKMPGRSGLRLADELRGLPRAPEIVFVTAFSRFAVEAFSVAAIDYLVKPVEPERLREAVDRARAQLRLKRAVAQGRGLAAAADRAQPTKPRLFFKSDTGATFVDVERITWVESERDYVRVHGGERVFFFRATLAGIEERLRPHGFVRVHRSALVALAAIEAIVAEGQHCLLVIRGGHRIAVSRRMTAQVRALIAATGINR